MGGHVATPPPHISAFCAKHIMQMHITHHTMQHFLQRKQGANFSVLRHAAACFKTPTNRPPKQVLRHTSNVDACSCALSVLPEVQAIGGMCDGAPAEGVTVKWLVDVTSAEFV